MSDPQQKSPATYFKEEVWALMHGPRYAKDMTAYEVLGAFEALKADLLEELRESNRAELDGDAGST